MAGIGITLVAAVGAAFLAVHRATAGGRAPRLRLRTIAGAAALVAGVGGVCTRFAFDSGDPALMAPAAYGSILLSIGFATFCPALLRMLLDHPGQWISLYAAIAYRAEDFGRQRLAGATPGQVLATVAFEGLMLTVTGVFFGTIAGVAGILPFTIVRTDSVLPDQGPAIWLGTVAVAAAATLITSLATAARALRTPAVAAVTA